MATVVRLSAFLALIAIAAAESEAGAASPASKCEAKKLKVLGQYSLCRLREQGKEVIKGSGAGQFAKCDDTFNKSWVAAESKWGSACPTTADATAIQGEALDFVSFAAVSLDGVRFVDNGDGTVTDTVNRLMWEKKDGSDGAQDALNPHDVDNRYRWSAAESVAPNGTVFIQFLAGVNDCLWNGDQIVGGLGGHCDWRLPTFAELGTLLDPTVPGCAVSSACVSPLLGPTAFQAGASVPDAHWTSIGGQGGPDVLCFSFGYGGAVSYLAPKSDLRPVRAVRTL